MTWYQIVSLIISALSLPTIAGLVWKDLYERRKSNSEHVNKLKDKEGQDILRSVIKEEIEDIDKKVNYISSKMDKISDGTLSSLRNDILTCYYRCQEKGYRNDYDYQNIHDLYDAYDKLNGNSFVHDIMNRFDNLPTKEQYEQDKKNKAINGEKNNGEN